MVVFNARSWILLRAKTMHRYCFKLLSHRLLNLKSFDGNQSRNKNDQRNFSSRLVFLFGWLEMCTVHTEPLLRSFRENWEYFYFPRRSNETVHRVQSVQFSSRELKYFRSRKAQKNDGFRYFFFFFFFLPSQSILQQQIIIRKTANTATLSVSTRFITQAAGALIVLPIRRKPKNCLLCTYLSVCKDKSVHKTHQTTLLLCLQPFAGSF